MADKLETEEQPGACVHMLRTCPTSIEGAGTLFQVRKDLVISRKQDNCLSSTLEHK